MAESEREPPIKIVIADDHVHEREGFKQLLSLLDFVEVIGEAASAQSAVQTALELRPDVVMMDLTWYKDRTAGAIAIQQIKEQAPEIKILAVTVYQELIEEARQAGADLAVDKDSLSHKSTLGARIRDTYASKPVARTQRPPIEQLSEREHEVLKLVALGQTDAGIAVYLHLSTSTVKKHVSSILAKLSANNRSAAIAIAYECGILRGTQSDLPAVE